MSENDDYDPGVDELNGNSSSEYEDIPCVCGSDFSCPLHGRRERSRIWKYFQKTASGKKGICRICGKTLSYGSTITNLKVHIKRIHKNAYKDLCRNDDTNDTIEPAIVLLRDTSGQTYVMEEDNIASLSKKMDKPIDGILLRWFKSKNSKVLCRICTCLMPQPVLENNLRMHLKLRHPPDYEKLQQLEKVVTDQSNPLEMEITTDAENTQEDTKKDGGGAACADGAGGAAPHLPDLSRASSLSSWDYYDNLTLEAATCRLCRESIGWGTSVDELRDHLLRYHADVAATVQDTDELNEHHKLSNDSNQLEEEYLDDTLEDAEVEKMIKKMHSGDGRGKNNDSGSRRRPDEHRRRSSDEKFAATDDEWSQNLDRFGLYVSSLLKMLPKKTALKFQVQIIDRVVRETMKADI